MQIYQTKKKKKKTKKVDLAILHPYMT